MDDLQLKHSFAWYEFTDWGSGGVRLLNKARAIGYVGVEAIDTSLWRNALDAGLRVTSHEGHEGINHGLNDPGDHRQIADEIRQNLELAAKYGVPNLLVYAGKRRKGISDEVWAQITTEGLHMVAAEAQAASVCLTLVLLSGKAQQADHTAWARRVVDLVNSPSVKILYHIDRMQTKEGDLIRTIWDNHSAIAHYYTSGNPARDEEVNYPAVLRAVANTGYTGYIVHEFTPYGNAKAALAAAYSASEAA